MIRTKARSGFFALMACAGALAATPAAAQFPNIFDSIFGEPPARPPADVPGRPPARVPSQPQYIPPGGGLPPGPPPGSRYQSRPLPPPDQPQQGQPQQGQPPGAPIQARPLPPPPGTRPAPQTTPTALPPGERAAPPASAKPPAAPAPGELQPGDELVVEPPPHKIANKTAVFSGLDKITGRIIGFDVAINETVRFGALEVTPRACYTRPPTETPNTDGFVEVDELTLQGELKRIFTGWMFAASPGLNAVEHPIYDVWLKDCKDSSEPAVAEAPPAPQPRAQPQQRRAPAAPPPQR